MFSFTKPVILSQPVVIILFQVSLIYKQVEGLYTGYLASKAQPAISLLQFR